MVNREIVLETIRKMYDSGIENSVIEATLKDIGLNDEEVKQYMAEVTGKAAEAATTSQSEQHELIAERAAEKIKAHLNEDRDERELRETTQHAAIEGQRDQLESVEKSVGELHQKVESLGSPANRELGNKLSVLEQRINGLERQLADLKALGTATKDLMEKVLEVNRKILNKL